MLNLEVLFSILFASVFLFIGLKLLITGKGVQITKEHSQQSTGFIPRLNGVLFLLFSVFYLYLLLK